MQSVFAFMAFVVALVFVTSSAFANDPGFKTTPKSGFKSNVVIEPAKPLVTPFQVVIDPPTDTNRSDKTIPPPIDEPPVAAVENPLGLRFVEAVGAAQLPVPKTGNSGGFTTLTYSASWCGPCKAMKVNFPIGDNRVKMDYTEDPPPDIPEFKGIGLPLTTWRDKKGGLRYVVGYTTPVELYRKIIASDPPDTAEALPEPVAGIIPTIEDEGRIGDALAMIARHCGKDAKIRVEIARRGGSLNLPFDQPATVEQILGKTTKVVLTISSAEKAITGKFEFDFEPAKLQNKPKEVGSPLLLAWTVVSIVNDLWALLHPKVSATIPETVVINAALVDGKAVIDFGNQPPAVRLHWSFWLGLLQVEHDRALTGMTIGPDQIVAEFHQSRFYRDLTFPVKAH